MEAFCSLVCPLQQVSQTMNWVREKKPRTVKLKNVQVLIKIGLWYLYGHERAIRGPNRQYQGTSPRTLGGKKAIQWHQLYAIIRTFRGLINHADTYCDGKYYNHNSKKLLCCCLGFLIHFKLFYFSLFMSHLWNLQPVLTNAKGWANVREEGSIPCLRATGRRISEAESFAQELVLKSSYMIGFGFT